MIPGIIVLMIGLLNLFFYKKIGAELYSTYGKPSNLTDAEGLEYYIKFSRNFCFFVILLSFFLMFLS